MKTGIFALTLLLATQTAFLLIPSALILTYTHGLRPFAYTTALIAVVVFYSMDKHPIPKKRVSIIMCGFGAGLYLLAVLVLGVLFGFANNRMAGSLSNIASQLWTIGSVAVMSEVLRHRLIKNTPKYYRLYIAVAITLVFTFVQFDALRGFIHFGGSPSTLFFGSIAPLLALNAVLTYIAHDGALSALVLLRAVYSLAVVFLPVLPNISGVAWAVVECAMLLITLTAYRYAMTDQRGQLAIAEKRREKYRRKSIISYMVTAGLVLVLIAFNLRAFPIFPVVVLTDSMAGAVDSGSIVFVERVQPANVLTSVGIGDVILYRQGSIEIMHRVIEFDYTIAGERVFITQGDNNPTADYRPVEMGQVLGISRSYIPYLGYPALWLRMIFR